MIADRIAALVGCEVVETNRMSGGSLSDVIGVGLRDGRRLVAKVGGAARNEADMLAALRTAGACVPTVVAVADDLLVMAEVASGGVLAGGAWSRLSAMVARLHAPTNERYGWDHDHAFGAVAVVNRRATSWTAFWAEHRLMSVTPHVASDLATRLERLAARLDSHLPADPPAALLHGDLWGGNVLVGRDEITLIDPACIFGDREVDVAMLGLFDRPPDAVIERFDLAAGWRDRQPVYRLWPLLVHLRLFGDAYRAAVERDLSRLGV